MRKVITSGLKDKEKKIKVDAISSKSYVHRILIGAALSQQTTRIKVNIISQDMKATMQVLSALGYDIVVENNLIYVNRNERKTLKKEETVVLDCLESGSTARFLLPVAAALGQKFQMIGSGKLPERPFEVICKAMEENGSDFNGNYKLPLNVSGKMKAGEYRLPGNISSQYISGLLFALPLLKGDSKIILTTELESKPYVDITLSVLEQFGIKVEVLENGYFIPGGQKYVAEEEMKAEGDWSNAAFPLCMGAIGNGVVMNGLNPNSLQGDKKIADLLVEFGCEISWKDETIALKSGELKGIKTDVSQIPDLVPVLCVVASFAEGDSYFYQAQRLRIKESDRIETTKSCLTALGGELKVIEEADGSTTLCITGMNSLRGGMVNGSGDHRIVMAASTAASAINGRVVIEGAEAVNKSYPGFFEDMTDFIEICEE